MTERERPVLVYFEKRGSNIRLPGSVKIEMIKNALNRVLAAGGDARFASCVQHRTSGDCCCHWYGIGQLLYRACYPGWKECI